MKSLLVRSRTEGAHVKARLFMGESGGRSRALIGDLKFREDEFGAFCEALYFGAAWANDLEIEFDVKGDE